MSTVGKNGIPIILGTGLLALDVVDSHNSGEPLKYWAGGTCGNVLLALRYLGWAARPVARLSADPLAETLIADLKRWQVDCKWVTSDDDGSTPTIVHKIYTNSAGQPAHSFSWRCSDCGRRYPGYKAVLATTAEEIATRTKRVDAFFFDRVSRGALVLAKACADKGALVVFEPSGVNHPPLFKEACEIAHVIKYSHERLDDFPAEIDNSPSIRLQIETIGEQGLRYRCRQTKKGFKPWVSLDAFTTDQVVDTAGAGDWTTAGILALAARGGLVAFDKLDPSRVKAAIRYGQALAAWACCFEGARGGMYAVDKKTFQAQVKSIAEGEAGNRNELIRLNTATEGASAALCSSCGPFHGARKRTRRSG